MTVGIQLLKFMLKWSGKDGPPIIVKVLKKLKVKHANEMSTDQKYELMHTLTTDYLTRFLGHRRFLVARAELVSILGISLESYHIHDRKYRAPKTPNLIGKPKG